jgi:hypothetical protein
MIFFVFLHRGDEEPRDGYEDEAQSVKLLKPSARTTALPDIKPLIIFPAERNILHITEMAENYPS